VRAQQRDLYETMKGLERSFIKSKREGNHGKMVEDYMEFI
jgi:hypothetical protein